MMRSGRMRRLLSLLTLCVMMLPACALGVTVETGRESDGMRLLRSYSKEEGYVYIAFGSYPQQADGTVEPCVWRVMQVKDGYAFLHSEYVLDFHCYHDVSVNQEKWTDYVICQWMNSEMRDTMFTAQELTAVRYTEEMQYLFLLDNSQFSKTEFGFRGWVMDPQDERMCAPTAYAMTRPDAYLNENGYTWYWSRSGRNWAGREYIVGFNGHISVARYMRQGGVRPACYVNVTMLDGAKGSGTLADPYVFEVTP